MFINSSTDIRDCFSFAKPDQILRATSLYCGHCYGSMLWDLSSEMAGMFYRSWNTCVKLAWNVPRSTHTYLLSITAHSESSSWWDTGSSSRNLRRASHLQSSFWWTLCQETSGPQLEEISTSSRQRLGWTLGEPVHRRLVSHWWESQFLIRTSGDFHFSVNSSTPERSWKQVWMTPRQSQSWLTHCAVLDNHY